MRVKKLNMSLKWHNCDIAPIGAIIQVVFIYVWFILKNDWSSQSLTTTPLRHLGSLGENLPVNNCGMYDSFWKYFYACIKVIFGTNHIYHNCLPKSSQLENSNVLMGWQSGLGMVQLGLYHDYGFEMITSFKTIRKNRRLHQMITKAFATNIIVCSETFFVYCGPLEII